MIIHPDSYTRGEGSNCRISLRLLCSSRQRVIMGSDLRDREHGLHRVVCGIMPETAPSLSTKTEPVIEIIEKLRDLLAGTPGPWDIFVDGSYTKTGGPFTSILFPEDGTADASASLVFILRHDDWRKRRVVSVTMPDGGKHNPTAAFQMELLALTTADLLIRKLNLDAVIFSDCTAAMQAIKDKGRLRYLARKHNLILLQQSKWLSSHMTHVRSHPEKYETDQSKWTRHMWGNHLADRSCAMDYEAFAGISDMHLVQLPVEQALHLYTHTDVLYWAYCDGTPTLRSFDEIFDANLLANYEAKRDEYRRQRTPPDPPKWSGPLRRSIRFATECAELRGRIQGDKARMLRIIWDHYQHGGNCRKMGISTGACNLCNVMDSDRHWISECQHPTAVYSRTMTEEAVQAHLETLDTNDPLLERFIELSAVCVLRHEEGHMHKLGMISHSTLAEIGHQLGIHAVSEEQRSCYHAEALKLGVILMDGVLNDYVIKRSQGKRDATAQLAETHRKRTLRKTNNAKRVAVKRDKRKNKVKVSKQTRLTDYHNLQHVYGNVRRNPTGLGAEDSREVDAGVG